MAGLGKAFSVNTLSQVGLAGAGAVAAAIAQTSVPITLGNDNIRDAVLLGVSLLGVTMGGGAIRSFAVGFGAGVTASLIRRNLLVG
jgi:hypothetical protein